MTHQPPTNNASALTAIRERERQRREQWNFWKTGDFLKFDDCPMAMDDDVVSDIDALIDELDRRDQANASLREQLAAAMGVLKPFSEMWYAFENEPYDEVEGTCGQGSLLDWLLFCHEYDLGSMCFQAYQVSPPAGATNEESESAK